jgi:hypothetical protein
MFFISDFKSTSHLSDTPELAVFAFYIMTNETEEVQCFLNLNVLA